MINLWMDPWTNNNSFRGKLHRRIGCSLQNALAGCGSLLWPWRTSILWLRNDVVYVGRLQAKTRAIIYAFAEMVPLAFNARLPDASGRWYDPTSLILRERRLHLT
jgi:hypothetical protein